MECFSDKKPFFIQSPTHICSFDVSGCSRVRRAENIRPALENARSTSTDVAIAYERPINVCPSQDIFKHTWCSKDVQHHRSQTAKFRLVCPPYQSRVVERWYLQIGWDSADERIELIGLVTWRLRLDVVEQSVEIVDRLQVKRVRVQYQERSVTLNVHQTYHVVVRLSGLLLFGKAIKPLPHLSTKTSGLGDPFLWPSRSTHVRDTISRMKN